MPKVHANVKLPAVFSDNMVCQRNAKIPIWGCAQPGEKIRISVNDRSYSIKADANGTWRTKLADYPNIRIFTMPRYSSM